MVRYGNVVGSRGSIVPFFQTLVANGAKELPVTDPRMTRFWITLPQGVEFVLKAFERMKGGEIFVPKIPSMRILDLCAAIAPDLPRRVVGIRPGEKLHEVMCPTADAHNTLEFHDHYVIKPTINFVLSVDYLENNGGERGHPVADGFEFSSDKNHRFLSVDELRAMNQEHA